MLEAPAYDARASKEPWRPYVTRGVQPVAGSCTEAGNVAVLTKGDGPADTGLDMTVITLRRSFTASLVALAVGVAALLRRPS